jgi:hypothetical protein
MSEKNNAFYNLKISNTHRKSWKVAIPHINIT